MSTFLDAPSDVLLLILSYVEVPEVFLLRQTCREVAQLTRAKSLWLTFLEHLKISGDIPLPPAACDPAVSVVDLSSSAIESIVVSATRASDCWLLPRETRPLPSPIPGDGLDGLSIFLDIWLLIVRLNGLVYLRNLQEDAPRQGQYATLDLRSPTKRWTHTAALDHANKCIMLALTNNSRPFETMLYQITVDGTNSTAAEFILVRTFTGHTPRTIRAFDVPNRLLVLSSAPGALDVVSWNSDNDRTSRMLLDDAEEWFDGVVALRLLGSHFLAIRTHTIELYACDEQHKRTMQPLKHRITFPLHEGSVSVSDAMITTADSGARSIRINVLAYDAHSLASYLVSIFLPGSGSASGGLPPAMDVTLTGEVRPPRSLTNAPTINRWFVSALALGPQAIRAMWVERHSLTMTRNVRLVTLNRNAPFHDMNTAASVFTLASYDLRDDLTHCALAEVSGRIVLGNRAGHVILLTPTRPPQRLN